MAKLILIIGESGSGKTTSMRNLDSKTTFYFDCDKKGLSWKGWRRSYNKDNKNYMATTDTKIMLDVLTKINTDQKQIKTVVIDTLNGIMIDDEMKRSIEKGYDKWRDLAFAVYGLIDYANSMREDLTVIFTGHAQVERDDNGYCFTRLRTSGKKLDKIVLESKFTTVLISKCLESKYLFETQARNSTAKSPLGAFENLEIENDINEVIKALEEY